MSNFMKEHWNRTYDSKETNRLGWYEKTPEKSLELLSKCNISKNDPILDVGVGASTFIDSLIEHGFTNIIATDISEIALNKLRERLGEKGDSVVRLVEDDITQPKQLQYLNNIAVWHDRALLHFLLDENQRNMYFSVLKKIVKKGGYVIIAVFSLKGIKRCSGLDIINYDQNMLADYLGEDFDLLEYFDHTYYTPSGESRPYIYTLFQKRKTT